jgi:hypothetical protein
MASSFKGSKGLRWPEGLKERMIDLAQNGASLEEIYNTILKEFPHYPLALKTIYNRLLEFGIKVKSSKAKLEEPIPISKEYKYEKEIQKLKDELAELKKLKVSLLREINFKESFISTVREAIAELPPFPESPIFPEFHREQQGQTAVLAICCLHLGEYVSPHEMAGFGEYDINIACARWQYCVELTIDILKNHHAGESIKHLYVVDLGDNISGFIHDELSETNLLPIGKQVVAASHVLSLGLRDLASHFPKVTFIGVPGNHPRLYRKPRFKNKVADNLDTLVYEQIGLECSNIPNLEVKIPNSFFHIENIEGYNFWFAHGDVVKGWNGIPYYGFDRAEAQYGQFLSRSNVIIDYWVWGNFHTAANIQRPRGARIMTGSFKGPDEFALGAVHTGSDPVQVLFGVHPKIGKSFLYDLNLKFAHPEVHNRYLIPKISSLVEMAKEAGIL